MYGDAFKRRIHNCIEYIQRNPEWELLLSIMASLAQHESLEEDTVTSSSSISIFTFMYLLESSLDRSTIVSTCIKTTLMITLHQEIGLHARCTMEVGKGDVVGG